MINLTQGHRSVSSHPILRTRDLPEVPVIPAIRAEVRAAMEAAQAIIDAMEAAKAGVDVIAAAYRAAWQSVTKYLVQSRDVEESRDIGEESRDSLEMSRDSRDGRAEKKRLADRIRLRNKRQKATGESRDISGGSRDSDATSRDSPPPLSKNPDSDSLKEREEGKGGMGGRGRTTLPPDWLPDEKSRAVAVEALGETAAATLADNFRDHYSSRPQDQRTLAVWQSTYRKWARSENRHTREGPQQNLRLVRSIAGGMNGRRSRSVADAAEQLIAYAKQRETVAEDSCGMASVGVSSPEIVLPDKIQSDRIGHKVDWRMGKVGSG